MKNMPTAPELQEQAKRLRVIRESLGLDRDQFAQRLRVRPVTLKNAENAITKLGRRTMEDAEALLEGGHEAWGDKTGAAAMEAVGPYMERPAQAQADVLTILRVAREPAVIEAAKALEGAAGLPADEALAAVVKLRLAKR